jgi:hypothetical protein
MIIFLFNIYSSTLNKYDSNSLIVYQRFLSVLKKKYFSVLDAVLCLMEQLRMEFKLREGVKSGKYLFLFGCAHKLFELGHIVFYEGSKTPGENIGIFFAHNNEE